jgi:hypothetical protein
MGHQFQVMRYNSHIHTTHIDCVPGNSCANEVQRVLAIFNLTHTVYSLWHHPYPRKMHKNGMTGTIVI